MDHIETSHCQKLGIQVKNILLYGTIPVTEHVFALLLNISHNIYEGINETRKGEFSPQKLQGFDLNMKTLGIIGTGNIGKEVVRIAKGFNMNILAFDVKPDERYRNEVPFEYVNLNRFLSESDIISLHIPANEKTRHFLSDDEFDQMKKDVILINISRGSVIDVKALVKALVSKKNKSCRIGCVT